MERGRNRVERLRGMATRTRSLYGLALTVMAMCSVLVASGGVALAASDPSYFNPDASIQLRSSVAFGKCLDINGSGTADGICQLTGSPTGLVALNGGPPTIPRTYRSHRPLWVPSPRVSRSPRPA